VTFNGQSFIINRQTGKLARSIQITYPNPLAAVIEASAEYASDVEKGHGPVDLKQTSLAGKIVPLPVTKMQYQMAKAAEKAGFGTVSGLKKISLVASTGKVMGSKFVIFRRVGKTGWIIPAQKPRPFMAETAAYIEPLFKSDVERTLVDYYDRGDTA